jgi:hypothetical protein
LGADDGEGKAARHCRNCGAAADCAYCPECGQETHLRLPTLREFLREAAGRYVALDGRFWRTIVGLLFRPGFLTREYLAGRRRRYIRPARLYLFTTLIFFAVSRFFVEPVNLVELGADNAQNSSTQKSGGKANAAVRKAEVDDPRVALALDDDFNMQLPPALLAQAPALQRRWDRFNRLPRNEKVDQLVDGSLRYAPYAMFVLLPVFALMLKIAYLGRFKRYPARPRLYGEHMVFAAHNHALMFISATAILLVPWGFVRFALLLWICVYFVASMRTVYRGRWIGLVVRATWLSIGYLFLVAVATVGLLVVAVLLR